MLLFLIIFATKLSCRIQTHDKSTIIQILEFTMESFIASRISSGENAIFPDKIEIDKNKVTYYKGTVVGYRSTVIQRRKIASVRIDAGLLFADIIIESFGGRPIVAHGFLKSDAKRIMALLS